MRHRGLRYMPALDGLRALAVLAVLLYHGNVSWAHGGYFGVDAFFVLSGFLITGLLLAEWRDEGGINFKQFWVRRARRLLPALALVVVAVAVYAARYAMPIELHQLRRDALSTIGYVANWSQIFAHQSYFEQFAAPSALKHTWSLAIEEQFYLVWPLLVFAAMRIGRGSKKVLLGGCLVLATASAIEMAVLYSPGHDPSRVYYGTDTRAQSLLIGAILAILVSAARAGSLPRRPHRVARRRDRRRDRSRVDLGADDGDRLLAVPRRVRHRRGVGRRRHRERDPARRHRSPRLAAVARAAARDRDDLLRPVSVALADLRVPDPGANWSRGNVPAVRPSPRHVRGRDGVVLPRRAARTARRAARPHGPRRDSRVRSPARDRGRGVDRPPGSRDVPVGLGVSAQGTDARARAARGREDGDHEGAQGPAASDAGRRLGRQQPRARARGNREGARISVLERERARLRSRHRRGRSLVRRMARRVSARVCPVGATAGPTS